MIKDPRLIYLMLICGAVFCAAFSAFAIFGYERIAAKYDALFPRGKTFRRLLSLFVPGGRLDSAGSIRSEKVTGVFAAIFTIVILVLIVSGILHER